MRKPVTKIGADLFQERILDIRDNSVAEYGEELRSHLIKERGDCAIFLCLGRIIQLRDVMSRTLEHMPKRLLKKRR